MEAWSHSKPILSSLKKKKNEGVFGRFEAKIKVKFLSFAPFSLQIVWVSHSELFGYIMVCFRAILRNIELENLRLGVTIIVVEE